jgi:hypothetical protein
MLVVRSAFKIIKCWIRITFRITFCRVQIPIPAFAVVGALSKQNDIGSWEWDLVIFPGAWNLGHRFDHVLRVGDIQKHIIAKIQVQRTP